MPVQEPHHDHAQEAVEQREREEGHDQAWHRRDGVRGLEHAVDHPGLPAQLRHHPARLDREEPHRCGEGDRAQQPALVGEIGTAPRAPAGPQRDQSQIRAERHHELKREVHRRDVGPLVARRGVEPLHDRARVVEGEERKPGGDVDGKPRFAPVHVRPTA